MYTVGNKLSISTVSTFSFDVFQCIFANPSHNTFCCTQKSKVDVEVLLLSWYPYTQCHLISIGVVLTKYCIVVSKSLLDDITITGQLYLDSFSAYFISIIAQRLMLHLLLLSLQILLVLQL